MPYLTNFFGWEFFVGVEHRDRCWTGVVRVTSDAPDMSVVVRCDKRRWVEALAVNDAQELALEWAERLEQSPRQLRYDAESSLLQAACLFPNEEMQGVQFLNVGTHHA
ncbi:MAG: hypothetical protein PGN26_14350 [Xylophilus ampelinus]